MGRDLLFNLVMSIGGGVLGAGFLAFVRRLWNHPGLVGCVSCGRYFRRRDRRPGWERCPACAAHAYYGPTSTE